MALKLLRFYMWYYTQKEAEQAASKLRKRGKHVEFHKSLNRNRPQGGKYVYDVYYR